MAQENDRDLGARFWLAIVALSVGAVVAGVILFSLFGWVWYTWGFFGAFLSLCAVALAFGYVVDRRDRRRNRVPV